MQPFYLNNSPFIWLRKPYLYKKNTFDSLLKSNMVGICNTRLLSCTLFLLLFYGRLWHCNSESKSLFCVKIPTTLFIQLSKLPNSKSFWCFSLWRFQCLPSSHTGYGAIIHCYIIVTPEYMRVGFRILMSPWGTLVEN